MYHITWDSKVYKCQICLPILLSKEDALQGLILHFNLSVKNSDIVQGLLDGTTLSPSPLWPPLRIGPFLERLSSKPKDLHIAILSLFLKDSHAESSGSLGQVLGEYLHGQCNGWKVVDHCIAFDFGGSSHLNYKESSQQECHSKQVCLHLFHYKIY